MLSRFVTGIYTIYLFICFFFFFAAKMTFASSHLIPCISPSIGAKEFDNLFITHPEKDDHLHVGNEYNKPGCLDRFVNNQIMYGPGEKIFEDGSKYFGQWKNGKFQGEGILIFSNGEKYFGEFSEGMIHGYGEIYYNSGKVYFGEWQNGQYHGAGILLGFKKSSFQEIKVYEKIIENKTNKNFFDGTVYEEEFKLDKFNSLPPLPRSLKTAFSP